MGIAKEGDEKVLQAIYTADVLTREQEHFPLWILKSLLSSQFLDLMVKWLLSKYLLLNKGIWQVVLNNAKLHDA